MNEQTIRTNNCMYILLVYNDILEIYSRLIKFIIAHCAENLYNFLVPAMAMQKAFFTIAVSSSSLTCKKNQMCLKVS